jgi:hypothetical protein
MPADDVVENSLPPWRISYSNEVLCFRHGHIFLLNGLLCLGRLIRTVYEPVYALILNA